MPWNVVDSVYLIKTGERLFDLWYFKNLALFSALSRHGGSGRSDVRVDSRVWVFSFAESVNSSPCTRGLWCSLDLQRQADELLAPCVPRLLPLPSHCCR